LSLRRELTLLVLANLFLHAAMAGTRMAAPLMALRQHDATWKVGVLLALFAVAAVVLAVPAGRMTDRYGLRRPFFVGAIVSTLGMACVALFPGFFASCFAALLTGAGLAIGVLAIQRHAGHRASDATERKQVFSWLALAPALSNFVGPFSAGVMIDWLGFQAAFIMLAFTPLVGAWLIAQVAERPVVRTAMAQPPTPAATLSSADTEANAAPAPRKRFLGLDLDLLATPGLKRLLLVNWLLSMAWDVHTFVVPVLGHEMQISATAIGTLLGVFAVAAAGIRLVIPVVASRLKEHQVLTVSMVAAGLLFALYPFMPNVWLMGLCSALLGIFLGAVQPMVMSALHHITPPNRHGEALGLRMMAINFASSTFPLIFGFVGGVAGVSIIFWAAGAMEIAGSRAANGMRRHLEGVGR
jgi:MFS family permease